MGGFHHDINITEIDILHMLVICSFLLMESEATTCRVVDMVDAEIPHVCFQTKHVSCRNPRTWLDNPLDFVGSNAWFSCRILGRVPIVWWLILVDVETWGSTACLYTGASGLWCIDLYIIPQFEGIRGLLPPWFIAEIRITGFYHMNPLR